MKRQTTIALSGVIFAVAVGMLGVNGLLTNPLIEKDSSASTATGTLPLKGHLTVIARDPDGNIKAYRQFDNLVVNQGKICATERLFTTGTGPCNYTLPFIYLAIGTGSTAEGTSFTGLVNEVQTRATATPTTSVLGSGQAQTTLSGTWTSTNTQSIDESGVFDTVGTATGDMFARKVFSSPVSLNNGDQLTVTWQITLG